MDSQSAAAGRGRSWKSPAVLLAACLFALSMHAYVELVHRRAAAALAERGLEANFSDLYPYWFGTRLVLREGGDPYGAAATKRIQTAYYGRPLDPSRPSDPKDEHRFIYPIYVCLLLAPISLVSFGTAELLFTILLPLAAVGSVRLWSWALSLRLSSRTLLLASVMVLGSMPFAEGYSLTQISLLAMAVIAGACAAVTAGHHKTAGVLLALATVKPHLALPFAAWFLLWSVGGWRHRKGVLGGFAATLGVLLAGSELILPGWFSRWWATVQAFSRYQKPPLAQVMFGESGGVLVAALVVLAVAATCWMLRRCDPGSKEWAAVMSLVAVGTAVVIPNADAVYDHLIMLPAALWLGTQAAGFPQWRLVKRAIYATAAALLGWQWLAAAAVCLIALASARWGSNLFVLSLPIRSEPALPFVALLLVGLFLRDEAFGRQPISVPTPSTPPR
ncbi:MAG TPA: glycosyltransferase family 87 protein [Terriglobales bacterium]|nr:glycosyltransferase family 87 protein [Terriglobales bacterium]